MVLDSLRRIVSALRVFDRETEKRLGLSAAQAFVLEKLKDADGISVNELANRTHTHQSSVSVVVQKLVSRGLVKRSSSDRDGRQVVLALTKKGCELQSSAPAAAQDRLISALLAMPGPHSRALGRLLVELIQKTGIHRERPSLFFENRTPRRRGKSSQ